MITDPILGPHPALRMITVGRFKKGRAKKDVLFNRPARPEVRNRSLPSSLVSTCGPRWLLLLDLHINPDLGEEGEDREYFSCLIPNNSELLFY